MEINEQKVDEMSLALLCLTIFTEGEGIWLADRRPLIPGR